MYCSWCGIGLSKEQWRAIYCWRCGAKLLNGSEGELGAGTEEAGGSLRSAPTRRVHQTLRVAGGTVGTHPMLCSVGAIGIGTGAIFLAPLLMTAGHWLIGVGLIAAGISAYINAYVDEMDCPGGEKLGLMIAGGGAVLTGAGYVLLGAGAVSVAVGVGGCVYLGARKALEYRQMKRCEVKAPLLLVADAGRRRQ